jgi:hypothetical protein
VEELPSYGENVIVLLLMDEFCLFPAYLGKVRFVFKTHGFSLYPAGLLRERTPAALAKLIRDEAIWISRLGAFAMRNRGHLYPERRMVVPLGYGPPPDLPIKPFAQRRYTLSFVGSIEQRSYHPFSVRGLLRTPKSIARARMARAVQAIAERMPGDIYFNVTGSFEESITSDGAGYAQVMSDTKICLAPRGSSVETFRLYEAMRQGCVVICDRHPPHWFYRDCPMVQIGDWSKLDAVLTELLADPARLQELHHRSLKWWEEVASERAVAQAMAARLAQSQPDAAKRLRPAEGSSFPARIRKWSYMQARSIRSALTKSARYLIS